MKKFLSALLISTMIPLSTLAVSLSELQNSDRYEKISERPYDTIYVEKDTIQSVRYAPPYYTIKCVYYVADFAGDLIFEMPSVFNYNYNRNKQHIFNKVMSTTTGNIDKALAQEAMIDSGMHYEMDNVKSYKMDGTFYTDLNNFNSYSPKNCEPNSAPYDVANYLFKKCYNETFGFEFQPKS